MKYKSPLHPADFPQFIRLFLRPFVFEVLSSLIHPSSSAMDSFTTTFFTTTSAEREPTASVPVDAEDGGSGGHSYCIVA
ncbi:hypothetical protein DENSPDRAFT_842580 [Dentipellis sp. KUC8613]|nr:hypothetical protein DENSPDRAFT_842580 [Dentipellis sp. KUC8613]